MTSLNEVQKPNSLTISPPFYLLSNLSQVACSISFQPSCCETVRAKLPNSLAGGQLSAQESPGTEAGTMQGLAGLQHANTPTPRTRARLALPILFAFLYGNEPKESLTIKFVTITFWHLFIIFLTASLSRKCSWKCKKIMLMICSLLDHY